MRTSDKKASMKKAFIFIICLCLLFLGCVDTNLNPTAPQEPSG
jgi:hypothetical protein